MKKCLAAASMAMLLVWPAIAQVDQTFDLYRGYEDAFPVTYGCKDGPGYPGTGVCEGYIAAVLDQMIREGEKLCVPREDFTTGIVEHDAVERVREMIVEIEGDERFDLPTIDLVRTMTLMLFRCNTPSGK